MSIPEGAAVWFDLDDVWYSVLAEFEKQTGTKIERVISGREGEGSFTESRITGAVANQLIEFLKTCPVSLEAEAHWDTRDGESDDLPISRELSPLSLVINN